VTEPHIQLLDDLEAEFARVAVEHERAPRGSRLRSLAATPRRTLAVAFSVLVLLGAGAYAVPPTRAAIDDLTSTFADWLAGDEGPAPGRALRPADDVPDWVSDPADVRVIAEAAGVKLYVTRQETEESGTQLSFWLGEGIGMGDSIEGWRERFDRHAVVVLGPALFGPQDVLDERGRYPLLGVTARSVERLELRYREGPPLVTTGVDGGFVMIADAWRDHRELAAYDAAGRELERVDLGYLDPSYLCDKEPTCPSRSDPGPPATGDFTYYELREAFHDYRGWVPRQVEQWVAPDGSGRVRTVHLRHDDELVGPRDQERWGEQDSPSGPGGRVRVSDERFGAGELAGRSEEGCLPPTRDLPADPDRLVEIFSETRAVCGADVPLNAKSFEYAASVLLQAGSSRQLRAALYEVVANLDGVELIGDARDPLGRLGTAVALDFDYGGRPARYELFFDPEPSQPLAFTEKLREPQDWVDGLLLRYRVLVESGPVTSIESRP
jgi:hypothetical protein